VAIKREDLVKVAEFRDRLVEFMNYAPQHVQRYGPPIDPDAQQHISSEQTWLSQEYGRIGHLINRYGTMQMGSHALGITSNDVIQDAIHDLADFEYGTIARLSVQHLDIAIGKLQAEGEQSRVDPNAIYRYTSPVYWIGRLVVFLRWLALTTAGRITAVIGAVVLAIIGGIVSGAAQAWFEQLLNGSKP
jgi:hypothetical protein